MFTCYLIQNQNISFFQEIATMQMISMSKYILFVNLSGSIIFSL